MVLQDRRYTKEHEWAKLEDGVIAIGITEHAQAELGDIVFVELPEIGQTLAEGEGLAVIESVKAVANVYACVAGEVVAVNEKLEDEPESINTAPYEGWIAKIQPQDLAQYEALLSADDYAALL